VLHTVQFSIPLRLYRITRVEHTNPAYYGRARTFRFDAPDTSYGVCYSSTSLAAAFMRTVPFAVVSHSGDHLVESSGRLRGVAILTGPAALLPLAADVRTELHGHGLDLSSVH
jgi:hypothetical protein